MDYADVFKTAGCEVLAEERFGSYQGNHLFKVRHNGDEGWINIWCGSCSHCDELLSWGVEYGEEPTKEQCIDFVASHLDNLLSQAEIEADVSSNHDWDEDAKLMLAFVQQHAIRGNA